MRSVVFLAAACLCFLAALGCALAIVHSNESAWIAGGLFAFALSFLP